MKAKAAQNNDLLADRVCGLLSPEVGDDYAHIYAGYAKAAYQESFGIEDEICVLDVETTGVSARTDNIIEIAIAKMRGPEIVEEFSTYVNPGKPIPREITELTSISDVDVVDAPLIDEVADDIRAFIKDCDIVAHNASFDRSFVEAACGVLPGQWLDSLVFLRCGLPLLRSFKLEDLMRAYCPTDYEQAHRAISDVRGLCHLWRVSLVGISVLDALVLRALPLILRENPEVSWIERVAHLYNTNAGKDKSKGSAKGDDLDQKKRAHVKLKTLRQKKMREYRKCGTDALQDAQNIDIRTIDADVIADDLSASGLAGSMYDSFEERPEQVEMACAIRDAFERQEHLAVEAGTGVGKSLAYLTCLARLAMENNITVGVATKTNALTDQLMGKDLPKLARALAQNGENISAKEDTDTVLRYASLKGYSHYPCLRKFNSVLTEGDGQISNEKGNLNLAIAQMLTWISQTAWGELSSINLALPYAQKQRFAASSLDCLRRRCSYYYQCYVHGARRIAKNSHIIVTNHSLLFRNSGTEGRILPPVRYWAIDEAHNVEIEARKQFTRSFAEPDLNYALKALSGTRGLPRRLLSLAPKYMRKSDVEKIAEAVDALHERVEQVQTISTSFFAYAHDLADHESIEHNPAYVTSKAARTHWIGPELRESAAWGALCTIGTNLSEYIQQVLACGKNLSSIFNSFASEEHLPDELSDLAASLAMLAGQAETLEVAINEPEPNLVYALHLGREYRGQRTAAIEVSQLEVGERVAAELLEEAHSVIFTSATLAVGDSFSRFSNGTGLDTLPDERWSTLQLASSYDLPNLMRIFVPTDLPEPRSHLWTGQLIDFLHQIHLRTNGGVLTLFTSRKDLLAARDSLQDQLKPEGIEVLAQDGMLSMRVLQERFIADHQASLLATKSFWEGFDASGDTLRCIVIPKLPFGRPDTPLARERSLVYGRSAWARYDLPETILDLKQAIGRLVRTSTDSGVVILADTRVLTKGYGKRILDSLPVEAQAYSQVELLDLL